ncbi:MAG: hypothetical protein ACYS8Y_10555 [Planctomycetota bacterium]|jgi:hypothetical protein
MLRQILSVPVNASIPSGDYWYDNISGLWGKRGSPSLGQILPGLRLGGSLSADASNGDTGVFINSREIYRQELAYLQRLFGTVNRGRYWLNGWGVGGKKAAPRSLICVLPEDPAAGVITATPEGHLLAASAGIPIVVTICIRAEAVYLIVTEVIKIARLNN